MSEYLTPKEAAEILKVHRRTVWRWIRAGKLAAQTIPGKGAHGKAYRIPKEAVQALLEGRGGAT